MNKLNELSDDYVYFAHNGEHMPWHALGLVLVTILFLVHLHRERRDRGYVNYTTETIGYVFVLIACHFVSFIIYMQWTAYN